MTTSDGKKTARVEQKLNQIGLSNKAFGWERHHHPSKKWNIKQTFGQQ
jgi:hypothetical protein